MKPPPALSEPLRHIWRVAFATSYAQLREIDPYSVKIGQKAGRAANEAVQAACELASEPWGDALDRTMAGEAIGKVDDALAHIARGGQYF
jgi:hypothetical protein